MKKIVLMVGLLTACSGAETNESANAAGNQAEPGANQAAPAADDKPAGNVANEAAAGAGSATAAPGGAPTRAFMIGKWSAMGDCDDVLEFREDGSLVLPWGEAGRWQLDGDRLTLSTSDSVVQVAVVSPNEIDITREGRPAERSRRC